MIELIEPAPHEYAANYLFDERGLQPFFALDRAIKNGGGSVKSRFEIDGERWRATLYYQDSGLKHPGAETPAGTEFSLDEMREFRIKVYRDEREDSVGEQSFNAHVAPRWQGLEAESDDGSTTQITVPESIEEGINVKISGSNIQFDRYEELLEKSMSSVSVSPKYFRNPHPHSNIQDAELYVRLQKDASGPIHGRSGPIAQMGHLLEGDRSGYRKVVQNDEDDYGNTLPGYYHTVTLGQERITEAFPHHQLPKEVKHYYAREAEARSVDDPLAHPKVGASYQVSRHDEKLGVDELEKLTNELRETLLSVLADSGIDLDEGGPWFEDAYFNAETTEHEESPIVELDLTRIEQRQESVVIKHLADGLSPVQWESLDMLVTDGGTVSPADIAEENGRHPDSVRRALRSIEELVSREYGEVELKSPHVAELVRNAVEQAEDSIKRVAETASKALEAAGRGLNDGVSSLIAWASNHDLDIRQEQDDYINVDLGTIEAESHKEAMAEVRRLLRDGEHVWTRAGRDVKYYIGGNWRATLIYDNNAGCETITDTQHSNSAGAIGATT